MAKASQTGRPSSQFEIFSPRELAATILNRPPLLQTERRQDFEALHRAVRQDVKPTGIIEDIYAFDYTSITWEILRVYRCKTATINAAFFDVLKSILVQVSEEPRTATEYRPARKFEAFSLAPAESPEVPSRPYTKEEFEQEYLPFGWFRDKSAKEKLAQKLARFGLDESVIEAQAIRLVWDDLELLDQKLISLEHRRDRLLRQMEAYRASSPSGYARAWIGSSTQTKKKWRPLRMPRASVRLGDTWRANGKALLIDATPSRAPGPVRLEVRNARAAMRTGTVLQPLLCAAKNSRMRSRSLPTRY
jgi:hypothetical protein